MHHSLVKKFQSSINDKKQPDKILQRVKKKGE